MRKKLLFMEDLVRFFQSNNLTKFSSSDSGYKLCVQVPATFEVDENVDDDHRGMMKLKVRVFHLDLNRNGSFVSKDAAKAAMPTIKNRPVMAYIHQRDDGEWDFEAHNVTVNTDENGNDYFEYQEKQVGSFDESEPFFEYDKELDKTFVCAYAYISEDYTRACDIIRRKGGTKNSVELSIEELAYNAKESYLDLQKFYVSASTLLGSYDDGTEVAEGMIGSRADIVDFSEHNNSILSNSELINTITDAVIKRLGDKKVEFSTENKTTRKEENPVDNENVNIENVEFEEAETEKVVVDEATSEEVEVETTEEETLVEEAEISEEEVAEEIAETPEVVDEFVDDNSEDEEKKDSEDSEEESEDVEVVLDAVEEEAEETKIVNTLNIVLGDKKFELSLSDIQYSIETIVNEMYGETDNTYYGVIVYADSKTVVMIDVWNSGRAFKQSFKERKGTYSLVGERVPVHSVWVTSDEEAELDRIRSNYSAIESELNTYKSKELHSQREAVLASEDYSVMSDFAEFNELKNHMDDYSVEDLTKEADLLYAKFMKSNYSTFASKETKKTNMIFMTSGKNTEEEKLPYGGLFKNFKAEK